MKLPARLEAVAACIPRGSRVADVGCDHGILARSLVERGIAGHVVATEIDAERLLPAREAIEPRAGHGLGPLRTSDRLDVVVVAGLGGPSIVGILDDPALRSLSPSRLVLQPQNRPEDVRTWLVGHGWRLADERSLIDRDRRYVVLAAVPGDGEADLVHPDLDAAEMLAAGPLLVHRRDPDAREEWRGRVRRLEAAAARARGASRSRVEVRLASARRILRALTG